MFGLGFTELLLIMIVALVVFGPQRLPEIAKTLGKTMGELRRAMDEIRYDLTSFEQESQQRADSKGGASKNDSVAKLGAGSNIPEQLSEPPFSVPAGPQALSLSDTCEAEKLNRAAADVERADSSQAPNESPPAVDSSAETKKS